MKVKLIYFIITIIELTLYRHDIIFNVTFSFRGPGLKLYNRRRVAETRFYFKNMGHLNSITNTSTEVYERICRSLDDYRAYK